MYKFKQDLAMAYFDGCSKKTASRLFSMLKSHRELMPSLISRRQYNDRRKYTAGLREYKSQGR